MINHHQVCLKSLKLERLLLRIIQVLILLDKDYYADGCEGCLGSNINWGHRVLKGRFNRLPEKIL